MADIQYPVKEPSRSDLKYLKPIKNKFRGDNDSTYETWKHQIKGRLMQAWVLYHIQIDDENDFVAPVDEEDPVKKTQEQRMINQIVIASFLMDCISEPPLKYITFFFFLNFRHQRCHLLKWSVIWIPKNTLKLNCYNQVGSTHFSANLVAKMLGCHSWFCWLCRFVGEQKHWTVVEKKKKSGWFKETFLAQSDFLSLKKKNQVGSRRLSLPNLIFFPSPAVLVKPRLVEHFREICYVQWKEYILFP